MTSPESARDQGNADRTLAETEQRYRVIAENAGDVVFETGSDAVIRWVSPSIEPRLGWQPAELAGRAAPTLVHPDDVASVIAGAELVRSGAHQAAGRSRVLGADGSYRWFAWVQRAVVTVSDAEISLVTSMQDIQAEVDTEEALASSLSFYRLLAENSSDVIVLLGRGGVVEWVSPAATRTFGWDAQGVVGTTDADFVHPDDLDRFTQDAPLLEEGGGGALTFRLRCGDGTYMWVEAAWQISAGSTREQTTRVVRLRDVATEMASRLALAKSEERFRLLAENASDVVLQIDGEVVAWASPSLMDALGWTPQEWVGTRVDDHMHPDDLDVQAHIRERLDRGERVLYRVRLRGREREFHWCEVHARSYSGPTGDIEGVVASFRVIDSEMSAREALARSEELFRTAMDSAPIGMAVLDLDRRFVEVNPALCRMLDREPDWLVDRRIIDVIDPEEDEFDLRMRALVLSGRRPFASREKRMRRADGTTLWVEHSIGLLRDDEGIPRGFVSQFVNVTEAREAREQLLFMATHDPLTRLVNRPELLTRLDQLLSHAPRTGTKMAALFIDLDDLKSVNDTYGHGVGDDVIVNVAERLGGQVRSGDLVARLGGDEFVVLLPAIHTLDDANRIAEKLHDAVGAPMTIEGTTFHVTVSIGVALAGPGDEPDSILDFADRALYQAKRTGRGTTVTFDRTP